MRKRLKILFTISVLANVLLGGALIGAAFDHRRNDAAWEESKAQLSPEGQKLVAEFYQSSWKQMVPQFKRAGNVRREMAKVMAAETFDGTKFDRTASEL